MDKTLELITQVKFAELKKARKSKTLETQTGKKETITITGIDTNNQ